MKRVTVELMIPTNNDEGDYAMVLRGDAQVTEEGRVLALDTEGAWRDIGCVHESFMPDIMASPHREPWAQ